MEIVIANVREEQEENDRAAHVEVFTGETRTDHPSNVAMSALAERNGRLRVIDRKSEVVGTAWLTPKQIPSIIRQLADAAILSGDKAVFLELEDALNHSSMVLFDTLLTAGMTSSIMTDIGGDTDGNFAQTERGIC
jgi:hypothetical protein